MRVGVVGGGINGLVAALELVKAGVEVVLYDLSGHTHDHDNTINIDGLNIDLAFMLFNRVSYPNLTALSDDLSIDVEASDMSFSVSLDEGRGFEWGTRNGLRSLYAQKSNVLNSDFRGILQEIKRFKDDAVMYLEAFENNPHLDRTETLRDFIKTRNSSELFIKAYFIPMCAAIWSCSADRVMDFSVFSILSFCIKHNLLQISGYPQWFTVKGGSKHYVNKLRKELEERGCQIRTNSEVHAVATSDKGCIISSSDGSKHKYDECILAVPPPDALNILGKEASHDEIRILGALQYMNRDVYLHRDKKFMPQNFTAWSALNFTGITDVKMCVTYWLNVLQNISEMCLPLLLTIDPIHEPEIVLHKCSTRHLVPSVAATKALLELSHIQGKRGIWFCGVDHGYGSNEDGLKSSLVIANAILKMKFTPLTNPKQMVLSWKEAIARQFLIRYLTRLISAGCLIFLEDGGSVLKFEGSDKRCTWKCTVRVHNPQFYWKVAMEADLGVADAFINGDFSMVDKNEGLLNFFLIILANLYIYPKDLTDKKSNSFKGWWTPMFFTAGITSAKYFWHHFLRRNTVTQARQNIARHYDMSNDMFSFFLDETMTYSCAIFKSEDEDLKVAQLRKLHLLIDKARVEKHHHVLEIGFGWGSLAIELVKKTGCRYTGVTLSEEQFKFAQKKAKAAGLEDNIQFLFCDYRTLQTSFKYDRIISCGMLEHVGDQYYEDFFRHCNSYLAENGILVVQTISIPEERFHECKRSSDFLKEYIFPGGCLPSLSRLTSAMANSSRLNVEHVETIGPHYFQTLRCWRKAFLENKRNIQSLGFDDKFMRVWEYYFDFSASGFKTRVLGNYQIVFTRQANIVAFSDPYVTTPSSNSCS